MQRPHELSPSLVLEKLPRFPDFAKIASIGLSISGSQSHSLQDSCFRPLFLLSPRLRREYHINNPFCTHLPLPDALHHGAGSPLCQQKWPRPSLLSLSLVQTSIRLFCVPKNGANILQSLTTYSAAHSRRPQTTFVIALLNRSFITHSPAGFGYLQWRLSCGFHDVDHDPFYLIFRVCK